MNPIFFRFWTFVAILTSFIPGIASADIYRCDKQAGVITLSNIEKGKNCTKMILPPPEKRPQNPSADASKSKAITQVDEKQSKSKSGYESALSERKRIIQEELDLEMDRLNKTDEKVSQLSNLKKRSAKQDKDLADLQKKQSLYRSNIALLQKELNK